MTLPKVTVSQLIMLLYFLHGDLKKDEDEDNGEDPIMIILSADLFPLSTRLQQNKQRDQYRGLGGLGGPKWFPAENVAAR
jgi:hypothetical protein